MATTAQSLSRAIQGLWRDRSNDPAQLPSALTFAPVNPMLGNGQFQILSNDLRLDDRDADQGAPLADNSPYASGQFGYGTVSVQTQRHSSLLYKLPQNVIDAIQGQNGVVDVAEDAMKAVSNQILDYFTGEFLTAVNAEMDAAAGGTLDLSDVTTDIIDYFDDTIEEIEKASAKRPTHLLMGAEAFRAFRNMDQVQGATALGSIEGGSRRTGYAPLSAVGEFFRQAFGIEILVENRTKINGAGAGAYALSTTAVLGYAGDPRGGCVTTFAKDGGLIDFDVRDLSMPDPVGIGVAANADYLVKVTDPAAGRRIALTLP